MTARRFTVAALVALALAGPAHAAEPGRVAQAGSSGGASQPSPDARLVDVILAEVGSGLAMLSDVALARALGAFGLTRSDGPISEADLARFLDAQLAVREAEQLAIDVPADALERAWESAGGAALTAKLEAVGIDPAWARRVVEADLRVQRFVELRFQAFAFVTDFDVDDALGPGAHSEAVRERTRERLRADQVARAYGEWLDDARQRVGIRRLPGVTGPWPAPFTLGSPQARGSRPRR